MSWIAGGGIVAGVVAFYQQIKSFLLGLIATVIKTDRIEIDRNDLFSAWTETILKTARCLDFSNSVFSSRFLFLKSYKKYFPGIFEIPKNNIFLFGKIPVYVNFGKRSISYLRGTFKMKDFLKLVSKTYEINTGMIEKEDEEEDLDNWSEFSVHLCQGVDKKTINIGRRSSQDSGDSNPWSSPSPSSSPSENQADFSHRLDTSCLKLLNCINFDPEDVGEEMVKSVDRIYFSEEAGKLFRRIKVWRDSRDFFISKNIAWRGGAGIFGPPGAGKSMTVKEICRKLGLRLYVFDLSSMNNQEFHNYFFNCSTPCVCLFEDIDAVWEGRKILGDEDGVTFDLFLNSLSSSLDSDGRFVIATSNFPEKLDSALMRPGRLDECLTLGPLCDNGRKFLADKILGEWRDERDKLLKETDELNLLGADFENRCVRIAVAKFWEKHEKAN